MAGQTLTLQTLVEAIMGSISEAQDQIERQTLQNIYEWFDEDGRPKMISFRVPAFGPEADKKRANGETPERELHVPLITLTQNNPIKIKKLTSKVRYQPQWCRKFRGARKCGWQTEKNSLHRFVLSSREKRRTNRQYGN
ncbi:DUF2589 domain-containing protein [Pseudoalteromonas xiamenensis]